MLNTVPIFSVSLSANYQVMTWFGFICIMFGQLILTLLYFKQITVNIVSNYIFMLHIFNYDVDFFYFRTTYIL